MGGYVGRASGSLFCERLHNDLLNQKKSHQVTVQVGYLIQSNSEQELARCYFQVDASLRGVCKESNGISEGKAQGCFSQVRQPGEPMALVWVCPGSLAYDAVRSHISI